MAKVTIKLILKPHEYDIIIDALMYHQHAIEDELANPISLINDSENLQDISHRHLSDITDVLDQIYGVRRREEEEEEEG